MTALHNLADTLPVAPVVEATTGIPARAPSPTQEPPSISGLRRPHNERPSTPTGEASEDEEGALGGAVLGPVEEESEEGGEIFSFTDTSSYSSLESRPSPPQGASFSSERQLLELRWEDALERALRTAREGTVAARKAEAAAFREWDLFHASSRRVREFSAYWAEDLAKWREESRAEKAARQGVRERRAALMAAEGLAGRSRSLRKKRGMRNVGLRKRRYGRAAPKSVLSSRPLAPIHRHRHSARHSKLRVILGQLRRQQRRHHVAAISAGSRG